MAAAHLTHSSDWMAGSTRLEESGCSDRGGDDQQLEIKYAKQARRTEIECESKNDVYIAYFFTHH